MRAHALIPQFVRAASQGDVLRIEGDGSHTRPFVYITDLCDGIARCVVSETASGVYNLVGPTEASVRHVAEVAQSLFPQAGATVEHAPPRAEQMESDGATVSGARAQQDLGWSATVGLREGIHRYAAWYCESVGSAIGPMDL